MGCHRCEKRALKVVVKRMEFAMQQSGNGRYVLKFISGKYQGGEFALEMNQELIIGRSSELEMVLIEDMVSRHHAKITTTDREIFIEDMGSTNGTFVNGEKISRMRLSEGDRILIGTSIIRLVYEDAANNSSLSMRSNPLIPSSGVTMAAPELPVGIGLGRSSHQARTQHGATQSGVLSGVLDQVSLPDLLQLFGSSKKSGCLYVNTVNNTEGRIYLREGRVYGAVINENYSVPMDKSFYRMITWTTGTFLLDNTSSMDFENPMDESVESLMMEGMRILDEIRALGSSVPAYETRLAILLPMRGKLRDLSPEELDIFQIILHDGLVENVLNQSNMSDLDAFRILVDMIKKEIIS